MSFLTEQKIDLAFELSKSHYCEAGGIVLFSGEARKFNKGREVKYLEYEAHLELANSKIQEIIDKCKKDFDLKYVHVLHRLGKVEIMECAVVVITASAHRKEAYNANMEIINRIKHEVPIWKKEIYKDGSYEWALQCEH